tara:strand:+ start:103 stop:801 length:699 start_codon:yes stop_codon:yes gene_type:complete
MQKGYYLNKYTRSLAKKKHYIKRIFKRKGWIAHHGLERSGTNFFRACLLSIDIDIINKIDPQESNPKHKHFRWYENKSLIPHFRKQFFNNFTANNIKDINAICGYPVDTSHFVIKKTSASAITSLSNYAIREGWFTDKKNVEKNILLLLKDYKAYYNFWQKMSDTNSSQVQIISYEDLVLSSFPLIKALEKAGIKPKLKVPIQFIFDEVYQSDKDRRNIFSEKKISEIISKL